MYWGLGIAFYTCLDFGNSGLHVIEFIVLLIFRFFLVALTWTVMQISRLMLTILTQL